MRSSLKKVAQIDLARPLSILMEASRLYAANWVRDIGPELRPNDFRKDEEGDEVKPNERKNTTTLKEDPHYLKILMRNLTLLFKFLSLFALGFLLSVLSYLDGFVKVGKQLAQRSIRVWACRDSSDLECIGNSGGAYVLDCV